MALTTEESLFCAAFATTARRDPYLASTQAGLGMTRDQALRFMVRPGVREELERLSLVATCTDGEVTDVKPVGLLDKHAPRTSPAAARRLLQAKLRCDQGVPSENPSESILDSPACQPSDAPSAEPAAKPEDPITPADERRALRHAQILTERGEVAGSPREVYNRVMRAARGKKSGSSLNRPDPSPIDADKLEAKLAQAQTRGVAQDRGDGNLYLYDGDSIATPYRIKQFLTQVMEGQLTGNMVVRMQATLLLAKVHGMLDPKNIEREKQLDALVPESEDELRAAIEKTRAELKRLKAGNGDDE